MHGRGWGGANAHRIPTKFPRSFHTPHPLPAGPMSVAFLSLPYCCVVVSKGFGIKPVPEKTFARLLARSFSAGMSQHGENDAGTRIPQPLASTTWRISAYLVKLHRQTMYYLLYRALQAPLLPYASIILNPSLRRLNSDSFS